MSSRHPSPAGASLAPDHRIPSESGAAGRAVVSPAPRWFVWLGLIALSAYAFFLAMNSAAVAAGADSSGYFNSARLLAVGEFKTELRVPREFGTPSEVNTTHFSPLGFRLLPNHPDLVPTYPTGLPLHLAAAGRLAGWEVGPLLMQVLAAVGAVWLCYLAARLLGVGFALAGAGAVMLAVFPVFIFTSIQTLSDTLATTWVLAAFVCGFRARTDRRWAAACGAAFAVSVLVRPTNFLVTPALAVLLGLDARRLLLFVAGGLPAAVWLALYNHNAYGGALRSGYGNPFEAFGLQYGMPTVVHFTKWLSLFLPTIVLLLPIAAWLRRDIPRRELVALGFAIAAIIGVYLFYDVSHDAWWCLRFILPAVGAWIIAGVLGVEALARGPGSRWPGAFRPVAAIVLTLWATGFSWYWVQHLHVLYVPRYEHAYGTMANVVRERLPDNAIVVCSAFSGALYYHTKLPALVYHAMSPGDFARYVRLARQAGRPIYAVVFDIEEEEAIRSRCPGEWKQVASVDNIILWQLE